MGQVTEDSGDEEDIAGAKVQASLQRLGAAIQQREAAKVLQLPFWPEPTRGVPNELIRSALFAAIQGMGAYLSGRCRDRQSGRLLHQVHGTTPRSVPPRCV